MANSKIIFGGQVLIDLTGDSITEDKVRKGVTFHGADGERKTGTNTFDADTSDATVKAAEQLEGTTSYARGEKVTGSMPNKGAVNGVISQKAEQYTIPYGFHDGSGKVGISSTEQAKIVPENIRAGVEVLGVTGSMSGSEDVKAQAKTTTPTTQEQTILPDAGYNYLSQVKVGAIPYEETDNSAGGKTVTIA